jgi:hypothetical protein
LPELPSIPSFASLWMHNDDSHTQIKWKDSKDGSSLKLEMDGEIEFTEDDSGILRMGDDAYFELEEKNGRSRIKVEAEPDKNGNPVYRYKVGRKTKPFDEDAAAWLSDILKDIIPEIAINADERVRRAYDRGGSQGVIELLDRIDSDYSKSRHYKEFFALKGLRDVEIGDGLKHMARNLDSDYELATVLASGLDRFLAGERTRNAFLSCLTAVDSDYEKARVIKNALDKNKLTGADMAALLTATGDINSDYETARVLTAVDVDLLSDSATRSAFFKVLKDIDSDYEKARVLSSLARHAKKDETLRKACMDAAETIDSEYEYGRVIKALR